MATKIGPLQGVKVVEVCMFQQAPVCFAMMADMGADVVKIEPPKTGELGRRLGPFHSSGIGGYFENNNRSKRSLTIDYRKKEGLDILYRLASKADVFAQNYRPGVAARRGFAYEDIVGLDITMDVTAAVHSTKSRCHHTKNKQHIAQTQSFGIFQCLTVKKLHR